MFVIYLYSDVPPDQRIIKKTLFVLYVGLISHSIIDGVICNSEVFQTNIVFLICPLYVENSKVVSFVVFSIIIFKYSIND